MNTLQNGTFSVIHSSGSTDFNTYMYSAVYCATSSPITINGELVQCTAGHTIPVIVKSAGTTLSGDFLLLGNPKPAGLDKTGKISGSTYQWIDIKTGLPIQQS
jgi:hypothetical protein